MPGTTCATASGCRRDKAPSRPYRRVRLTFIAVTSAWVLFRASSLGSAGTILSAMYGIGGQAVVHPVVAYLSTQWQLCQ